MLRTALLLASLAALALGALMLLTPSPAPLPTRPPVRDASANGAPAVAAMAARSGLATPLGDALFRWRCTEGLREALAGNPAWPLRRVARLCLCAAERLRAEGPRDLVPGDGDLAAALAAAEGRLCRAP